MGRKCNLGDNKEIEQTDPGSPTSSQSSDQPTTSAQSTSSTRRRVRVQSSSSEEEMDTEVRVEPVEEPTASLTMRDK